MELHTSNLQNNTRISDRQSGGGSPLSLLGDRVNRALSARVNAAPEISVDKINKAIAGIAGKPLPGMNHNNLV